MARHPEQTRRRLAQTASRLRSLVHPEAIEPDSLTVSERDRPRGLGGGARPRLPARRARRGVRPRVGDLLVSDRGARARGLGGRPGRPALGQRQRGDPVARRRGAPGPVLRLARAAHRSPRCSSRRPAASGSSSRSRWPATAGPATTRSRRPGSTRRSPPATGSGRNWTEGRGRRRARRRLGAARAVRARRASTPTPGGCCGTSRPCAGSRPRARGGSTRTGRARCSAS